MNALINLVLSIVFNFLPYGTINHDVAKVTLKNSVEEYKEQSYQIKDLRSHYLITKEEVSENLVIIN